MTSRAINMPVSRGQPKKRRALNMETILEGSEGAVSSTRRGAIMAGIIRALAWL
jgi:hypothetical protein